jgi:hypothetical protein
MRFTRFALILTTASLALAACGVPLPEETAAAPDETASVEQAATVRQVCRLQWLGTSHTQNVSSYSECVGLVNWIGNEHCTQVRNGAWGDPWVDVTATYYYYSYAWAAQPQTWTVHYVCN